MADLHERLLAVLAVLADDRFDSPTEVRLARALRAVVELHAPVDLFEGAQAYRCRGCDKPRMAKRPPWPCSTIQAIARELGVGP